MRGNRKKEESDPAAVPVPQVCVALHRALAECHRRTPPGIHRDATCRHLNRSLAQCVLSSACPEECEAVRSMCASAGTEAKRRQCQQAKISLSLCLSSHQQD